MPRVPLVSVLTVLTPLTAIAGTQCSSSGTAGAAGGDAGAACFAPQASDFNNYHSWTTFHEDSGLADSVPSTAVDGGRALVHDDGVRIEYINHPPPHGSTEYPAGTLIVKEIPSQQQVFAMAKRCPSYNPYDAGAAGSVYSNWEWFELAGAQDNVVTVWDGLPPDNQVYSGNNPYVCNQCHSVMGAHNDFVASPVIRLENF